MGKLRILAISLLGAVLAGSCSASSGSADLVELTTTSTITTTTIAQPSSSTTEASTTTSQAPTTTSEATPTTTLEQLTAEIEADLQAGRTAFSDAMEDPRHADKSLLGRWFTEDGLAARLSTLSSLVERGQAVASGTYDEVIVESATRLDGGSVLVVYCLTNDAVVFDTASGSVVDDAVYSFRYSTVVHAGPFGWQADRSQQLSVREGYSCG